MRKKNQTLSSASAVVAKISDAEWVVMRVLWRRGRATANEVVDALADHQDWKPKTIHTLLRRLVDKGVLDYKKSGREYVFRPLVDRESAEQVQSRSFISRIFEGKTTPFLARFIERESFSPEEIEELKRLLDSKQS
jgi:BlaI family transcriptional regulator, penicillinase repressor